MSGGGKVVLLGERYAYLRKCMDKMLELQSGGEPPQLYLRVNDGGGEMKIEMYQCDICGHRWSVANREEKTYSMKYEVTQQKLEASKLNEKLEYADICGECAEAVSKAVKAALKDRKRANYPDWLSNDRPGYPDAVTK